MYRLFRKNMLCRLVMEIHFLVMEKSWKIIVEKEWSPCNMSILLSYDVVAVSCVSVNVVVEFLIYLLWYVLPRSFILCVMKRVIIMWEPVTSLIRSLWRLLFHVQVLVGSHFLCTALVIPVYVKLIVLHSFCEQCVG